MHTYKDSCASSVLTPRLHCDSVQLFISKCELSEAGTRLCSSGLTQLPGSSVKIQYLSSCSSMQVGFVGFCFVCFSAYRLPGFGMHRDVLTASSAVAEISSLTALKRQPCCTAQEARLPTGRTQLRQMLKETPIFS